MAIVFAKAFAFCVINMDCREITVSFRENFIRTVLNTKVAVKTFIEHSVFTDSPRRKNNISEFFHRFIGNFNTRLYSSAKNRKSRNAPYKISPLNIKFYIFFWFYAIVNSLFSAFAQTFQTFYAGFVVHRFFG